MNLLDGLFNVLNRVSFIFNRSLETADWTGGRRVHDENMTEPH
jgi:hypothetical protein